MLAKFSPKTLLIICLALNIGSLLAFTFTDIFWILSLSRGFTGLFQIFFGIYQPVWADVFGNEQQKALWLTYLIIATPLGVIIGYVLCATFLNTIGWRWSFDIQALLLTPSLLGLIAIPSKYFDIQLLVER